MFLARPCMAGSLWPNSRLGESYHCPLCPQACLRETRDQVLPTGRQDPRQRIPDQRQPATPKGRTARAATGSGAWAKTKSKWAPQEVWAGSFKQRGERLCSCQALGWAGQGESSLPYLSLFAASEGHSPWGEGGTALASSFFLIIFERFPAPSPRPFGLRVSRKFQTHKEGWQSPLSPRQCHVGRVPT